MKLLPNGNIQALVPVAIPNGVADIIKEFTPQDPEYRELLAYIHRLEHLFDNKSPDLEDQER